MEENNAKVYVEVVLRTDCEGQIRPLSITWEDGEVYEIDLLRHTCRAASTKAGGCGIRYTVVIGGRETYLFQEEERWFVERRHIS